MHSQELVPAVVQAAQSDQRGLSLTCTLLLHSAKVQFGLLLLVYEASSENLYVESHLSFGECSGFTVLNQINTDFTFFVSRTDIFHKELICNVKLQLRSLISPF